MVSVLCSTCLSFSQRFPLTFRTFSTSQNTVVTFTTTSWCRPTVRFDICLFLGPQRPSVTLTSFGSFWCILQGFLEKTGSLSRVLQVFARGPQNVLLRNSSTIFHFGMYLLHRSTLVN